jgi:hypothetical protein
MLLRPSSFLNYKQWSMYVMAYTFISSMDAMEVSDITYTFTYLVVYTNTCTEF